MYKRGTMRYRIELSFNIDMQDPSNGRSVSFRMGYLSPPISETLLKYIQTKYQKGIIKLIDTQPENVEDDSAVKKETKKKKEIEIGLKLNKKELKNILKEYKKEKMQTQIQDKTMVKDEFFEIFNIENNNLNVDEKKEQTIKNESDKDEIDDIFDLKNNNLNTSESTIEDVILKEIDASKEDEYFNIINNYKEEAKVDKISEIKERIDIDELIDFFIEDDLDNPNFNKLKKIIEGENNV
jgi:hypothetical protein